MYLWRCRVPRLHVPVLLDTAPDQTIAPTGSSMLLHVIIKLTAAALTQLWHCRPDLIDPALLRPGRLDVLLYVGVAEDSDSKLKVLHALTRKFQLEHDIDLPIIAEKCPPTFTGADMYALSSDAWMTALKRTVAQVGSCSIPSPVSGRHSTCACAQLGLLCVMHVL